MVLRESRDQVTSLVKRFASGEITNDEFSENFPHDERDPLLIAIYEAFWFTYSDLRTHRLNRTKVTPRFDQLVKRTLAFLASNKEYEWPKEATAPSFLFMLPWYRRRMEQRLSKIGDYGAWPFLRNSDATTDSSTESQI